jgi:hypothetical protein
MKKILFIFTMLLVGAFGVNAQNHPQSANEGFVGVSVVNSDIKADFNSRTFSYDKHNTSVGVDASYTRYFGGTATKNGVVGLIGDVNFNFAHSEVALATGMAGVTVNARNAKYVQPFVRVMGGVGTQHVHVHTLPQPTDFSPAFDAGVGLDFHDSKYDRYKLRVAVDYLNTGFGGSRQNNLKFTTGLVF